MRKKLTHLTFKVFYYDGDEPKEGVDQIWIQSYCFKKDKVVRVVTHEGLEFTWETGKCGFHRFGIYVLRLVEALISIRP